MFAITHQRHIFPVIFSFIVTDKNVWFIGSSFNEFGNRATCIAKVPDSSSKLIIKEIEKWYSSDEFSENIIDFAKETENG